MCVCLYTLCVCIHVIKPLNVVHAMMPVYVHYVRGDLTVTFLDLWFVCAGGYLFA